MLAPLLFLFHKWFTRHYKSGWTSRRFLLTSTMWISTHITHNINSIHFQCTLNSEVICKVTRSKYRSDYWSQTIMVTNIRKVTNYANKVKGFLQCTLWSLPISVKANCYKSCQFSSMLVLSGYHTHKKTYQLLSQYRDVLKNLCSIIILTIQVLQQCYKD